MVFEDSDRPPPALRRHFTYRLNVLSRLNDLMSQELYLKGCGLSLPETRCVRLLSTAQARQAAMTASAPSGSPPDGAPSQDNRTPAPAIRKNPVATRRSTFS